MRLIYMVIKTMPYVSIRFLFHSKSNS